MNVRAISLNVGKALLVSALFMLISVIISIVDGGDSALAPLLISFVITLIIGSFPFIFVHKTQPVSLRDGYLTIFFSWTLSFILGMLPYVLWGGEFTLINAWFESVSGYTTTGSTILNDIEALPRSLLFWRTSTHYIGGLGIVAFLLLVMPDASPYRLKLTNMELSSLARVGYKYKSAKIIWIISIVYCSLTFVCFLSLWLAGMSWFDALNHACSIIATGGFSTKNLSVGHFGSDLINVVVMVFMTVGAMHFGLIYAVFATRSLKPLKNPVVFYYLGSLAVMSVVTMFSLMAKGGYEGWGRAFMDASFNVISYMTTAGFAVCDNSGWPWLACAVLLLASLQCGCAGSTTGGIKVDRIVISAKAIVNDLRRRIHPSSVSQVNMSGQHLQDGTVKAVMMYIVLYIMVIIISVLAVMICGSGPFEAVTGVMASVGSVGPGIGPLGSLDNYASQPAMVKFIYTFDMFLGRVEIYPVLVVISMLFIRRK